MRRNRHHTVSLFSASENAEGTPWCLFWHLAEPEKSTKKPLPYAWLAVKPNNMLSSVGKSVGKKEGWLHEPLTFHWISGIDE